MKTKRSMRFAVLLVLAVFLGSSIAIPGVVADEIVGVVYRGWTDADCNRVFPQKAVTEGSLSATLTTQQKAAKGPLLDPMPQSQDVTACYCKDNYVMTDDKKRCVLCGEVFSDMADSGAVVKYFSDSDAYVDKPLLYKGEDIGCRCAKTRGNRVLDIDKLINENTCAYVEPVPGDKVCAAEYAGSSQNTDVAKVCGAGYTQEQYLGKASDAGGEYDCCCVGDRKVETLPDGRKICVDTSAAEGENDKACKAQFTTLGEVIACSEQDQAKIAADPNIPYLGNTRVGTELVACCCGQGLKLNAAGDKCVTATPGANCNGIPGAFDIKEVDVADLSDPLIKIAFYDMDPNYPLSEWEDNIQEEVEKNWQTECACGKDSKPADTTGNNRYDQCVKVSKDVLFVGLSPKQFAEIFDNGKTTGKSVSHLFMSSSGTEQGEGKFTFIENGPYQGLVVMDSGELDFYNEDVGRGGRYLAEAGAVAIEALAGGLLLKTVAPKLLKVTTGAGAERVGVAAGREAGERILREAVEEAGEGAVEAGTKTAAKQGVRTAAREFVGAIDDDAAEALGKKFISEADDAANLISKVDDEGLEAIGTSINRVLKTENANLKQMGEHALMSLVKGGPLNWKDATGNLIDVTKIAEQGLGRQTLRKTMADAGIAKVDDSIILPNLRAAKEAIVKYGGKLALAGAGYAVLSLDELAPLSKMKTINYGVSMTSGAISGALTGFAVANVPGAIAGALVGTGLGYFTEAADPTEMSIRWSGNEQVEALNWLVSSDIGACGSLEDGSGLKFTKHSYSNTAIDGWTMQSIQFQSNECTLLDSVARGGDFFLATLVPRGKKIECEGCKVGAGNCQKSTEWTKEIMGGTPICCDKCVFGSSEIAYYYPIGVAPTEAGELTGGFLG